MAIHTAPLRPPGIVGSGEVGHHCLARQAVEAEAVEDIANVAQQDDGRILLLVLGGPR